MKRSRSITLSYNHSAMLFPYFPALGQTGETEVTEERAVAANPKKVQCGRLKNLLTKLFHI